MVQLCTQDVLVGNIPFYNLICEVNIFKAIITVTLLQQCDNNSVVLQEQTLLIFETAH